MDTPQLMATVILSVILVMGALLVMAAMALRYKKRELQHKEWLVAMEKGAATTGVSERAATPPWTPRSYLLRGLMWLFTGTILTAFLIAAALIRDYTPASIRVEQAVVAKNNGATPEQVRAIMEDRTSGPPVRRLLWIVGLIPAGVGVSYLIAYRVERSAAEARS